MNLTRKPSPAGLTSGALGDYPEAFPKLTEEVLARFPSLKGREEAVERWYRDLRAVLLRDREAWEGQVQSLVKRIEALETAEE